MADDAILAGQRVVELAGGIAGRSAALHLAQAGADVVKVEPPGGDPARGTPPFIVTVKAPAVDDGLTIP